MEYVLVQHRDALLHYLKDANVRFPERPALVPDLDVYAMPRGIGLSFRGVSAPVYVRSKRVSELSRLLQRVLDGTHRLGDILGECSDSELELDLLATLKALHGRGLLLDTAALDSTPLATDPVGHRQRLFFGRHVGRTGACLNGAHAEAKLAQLQVAVVATGVSGAATVDLLLRSGVRGVHPVVWDEPRGSWDGFAEDTSLSWVSHPQEVLTAISDLMSSVDLVLFVSRGVPRPLALRLNDLCLRARVPWLAALDDGHGTDIGPFVLPFESACWACAEARARAATPHPIEEQFHHEQLLARDVPGPPRGEALFEATHVAALVVGEVVRWSTGLRAPSLLDTVQSIEHLTGMSRRHRIVVDPHCLSCRATAEPYPCRVQLHDEVQNVE